MHCEEGEHPFFDFSMVPGEIYLGCMTGPKHEVLHTPSLDHETLSGHSVVLILRISLFPHGRSRGMKAIPSPAPVFKAMVQSFVQS